MTIVTRIGGGEVSESEILGGSEVSAPVFFSFFGFVSAFLDPRLDVGLVACGEIRRLGDFGTASPGVRAVCELSPTVTSIRRQATGKINSIPSADIGFFFFFFVDAARLN